MRRLAICLAIAASVFVLYGCSAEKYGEAVGGAEAVKIKDVMLDPSYQGKLVTIEGVIITQCMSNGCWFFLNDGTGQMFINMAPGGFAIPPRTGKKARVTGVVQMGQDGAQIVARGVEVR